MCTEGSSRNNFPFCTVDPSRLAALLLLCILAAGCGPFVPKTTPAVEPEPADSLTDDIQELLTLAEAGSAPDSSIGDLNEAIAALEKVVRLLAQGPSGTQMMEVQWRLARACFFASEQEKEASVRLSWIVKGEDAGQNAVRERPDRVEGYYYLAVLKGRRAEISGLGFSAMILARKVEDLGEKAAEIDPSFEDGAPYRLLAMLYAHAPPWPTSIGDVDKAIEFAQMAIDLSDYPMNHLIMAEVLIEADELEDARDELKKVLAAPKVGRWANDGERWRPHARRLLNKIQE